MNITLLEHVNFTSPGDSVHRQTLPSLTSHEIQMRHRGQFEQQQHGWRKTHQKQLRHGQHRQENNIHIGSVAMDRTVRPGTAESQLAESSNLLPYLMFTS